MTRPMRVVALVATAGLAVAVSSLGAAQAGPGPLAAPEAIRDSGIPLATMAPPQAPKVISVMLELDAEPAVRAYTNAATPRQARAATRAAVGRVQALAASVRASLRSDQVLFEATNAYAGVAVRTRADRIDELASIPGVRAVHRIVPKHRDNFIAVPLIRAPATWTAPAGTGKGTRVGIVDTGIDYTHADFGGPGTVQAYDAALAAKEAGEAPEYPDKTKIAGGYDFAGNAYNPDEPAFAVPSPDDNPLDCEGHGTHVAGTTGGYGVTAGGQTYRGPWDASTPFGTMGIGPGVAPEATLYAIKIFGCEGTTELVIEALDYAVDPNGDGDFSDHLDVVNMSLGSSNGSPEDPDSIASDNAAQAGVMVVASAGNSGDNYEITSSPSVAARALSVAASEDNGQVTDGFVANIGGSSSTYPALVSASYDWADAPGAQGRVTEVGDWDQPQSTANNTDGCNAFSPEEADAISGKIVLLQWPDKDTARRCGSAVRVGNAADAGAIGVILGGTADLFTVGIAGDARIPAVLTLGSPTAAIHQELKAGGPVTARLDNSLLNSERLIVTGPKDPTDTAMDFTSRGTSLAGNVKPDVSAPGGTIFSAASGTGSAGVSLSGTSMAAPAVAGVAALVRAAHPTWTPEQVKAAIMNTADHDLYLSPGRTGPRYDNLRMGSGRIDAQRAVATDAVAYVVNDPGAVSVSFGVINAVASTSRSKTVRITDLRTSGAARSYSVSLQPVNKLVGATYSVSPSSVSLAPGASKDVRVTLTIDPRRLAHRADPTISLFPLDNGIMRDFLTDASSLLLVKPRGSAPLRVPVFSAPRPASTLAAPSSVRVTGPASTLTGSFALTGKGVDVPGANPYERERSRITALQLMAQSPKLPPCEPGITTGCVTSTDDASADIRYVGFTSDAPLISARGGDPLDLETPGRAYIGVATWERWRNLTIASFLVYLDTDNDGTPELIAFNTNSGQDVYEVLTVSVRRGDGNGVPSVELVNNVAGSKDTAKFYGNVATLPINLAGLANPTDLEGNPLPPFITSSTSTISYWIEAYGPAGTIIDVVGHPYAPLRSDVLSPALTAFTGNGQVPANAESGTRLTVSMNADRAGARPRLLLLHHLNSLPRKAQVVEITR